METIHTRYGDLTITGPVELHPNGSVKSCTPASEVTLLTPSGEFTPQFTTDDLRRREVAPLRFHVNGSLKSLSLETSTPVLTPAGVLRGEFLTFHDSGALHRIFPLNGKLSGYWTQEDEADLARPLPLTTPAGEITAKFISVRFDPEGRMLGLTLWPGEIVNVPTPAGMIPARIGIAFRENGGLRSLEPDTPVSVTTPVGTIQAFDPDAVGIHGDDNSLVFDRQGAIRAVTTTLARVVVMPETGKAASFSPGIRESLCGTTDMEPIPMRLRFNRDGLSVQISPDTSPCLIPYRGNRFHTEPVMTGFTQSFGELTCSI